MTDQLIQRPHGARSTLGGNPTVLAIADELTEDELVLRYHVEETDDGFSGEEGTFTICSFWLVSALTEIGEVARARVLCENCSPTPAR
jgi:GH15 family glucan-1,4-alpha-glucosidase